MRYGQIRKYDVANGPGIRTSIFVTGCTHRCPHCFNAEYQDFQAGTLWTEKETQQVINYLMAPEIEGLTILGGEPFQNILGLLVLLQEIKKYCHKNIWIYSGYTWEEIIQDPCKKQLLEECDVLVDGRFLEAQKDLRLKFRGSSNQRIIDIPNSLAQNSIILLENMMQ